jgi:sugar/nucleoside kinase (ribokinase family)
LLDSRVPGVVTVERAGIVCAGCWLVDHNKTVARWPDEETLASVLDLRLDGGGPAHNVAMDLARLGAAFPIWGMGAVGDDAAGTLLLDACRERGVDSSHIRVLKGAATSQTDVMTVQATGRRTFFHLQGANALLQPDDFDFSGIPARILHLGAPGVHRRLDQESGGDANGWVTVLRRAREAGLKTNLEMVSAAPDEIRALVRPCLKHLDTLIVNDYEAAALTGLDVVVDGRASVRNARAAAEATLEAGVRDLVVIHFPEGCVAASRDGRIIAHPSLRVPVNFIQGANGAGDAFVAGMLYGLHEHWPLEDGLILALCAAASALGSVSTTAAVGTVADCLELPARWGWRDGP